MAGILEAVAVATETFDIFSKSGGDSKALLKAIQSTDVALVKKDGSIMKLLGTYIIEPVCVISNDLKEEDYIDSIVGLHTDIFSSLYLQAFEVLRAVHGKTDNVIFDVLSTDNGGVGRAVLAGAEIALEDVTGDYMSDLINGKLTLSTEDDEYAEEKMELKKSEYIIKRRDMRLKTHVAINNKRTKEKEFMHKQKVDADNIEVKRADSNRKDLENMYKANEDIKRRRDILDKRNQGGVDQGRKDLLIPNAFQRMLEIEIIRHTSDGRRLATIIPITIKTSVIFSTIDNVINALSPNHDDKSFLSRLDDYRSGSISFMDFIFAGDIVQKYKKNKLKDEDDLLKLLQSRKISANSKLATSNMIGFEKHYTMYIISGEDKIKLERFLRGKLKSDKIKQKFLKEGYGLSVTIVDRDYERLSIYYTDMKGSSDLSIKNAVKREKNSGGDMDEIIKALMTNRTPTF